jgi:VCBS repeat-containing protein
MAKIYKIQVDDGKGTNAKPIRIEQGVGDKGAPVRVVAQKGARYELQQERKDSTTTAPDQLRVQRKGKNLQLWFDGSKQPDVVIEGYYNDDASTPTLMGLAEDGSGYEYVPQDPDIASMPAQLKDSDTPVAVALGGPAMAGSFELAGLPLAAAAGGISGWAIAGGALAAGAAAGGGGGGGGAGAAVVDTTAPQGQTGFLAHDELNDTGVSQDDSITSNTKPVIKGVAEKGATVTVLVNGKPYTTTASADDGSYEVPITDELKSGTYTPIIRVTDAAGNVSEESGTPFTVDTEAKNNYLDGKESPDQNSGDTTKISIQSVSDDTGTSDADFVTNDRPVLIKGKVTNFDATGAEKGDWVRVQIVGADGPVFTQNVKPVDGVWMTSAANLVDGSYTVKAQIIDAAGNKVQSAADQPLVISANFFALKNDEANASERGVDKDKKPIAATNPTGNVLTNDVDVQSNALTVQTIQFGSSSFNVTSGTSKDNGAVVDGKFGTLKIGADGSYLYTVDDAKTQSLKATDVVKEEFTYGMERDAITKTAKLVINIQGANDLAAFTPESESDKTIGADGTNTSGVVKVVDSDTNEAAFQTPTSLTKTFGSFEFQQNAGTGNWSYSLDKSKAAYQKLKANETATDTLTLTSIDGSVSKTVTVTVTGVNDAPVLEANKTVSVASENKNLPNPTGLSGATRLMDLVGHVSDVDVDSDAKGVAITSVGGTLWFTTNSGDSWTKVEGVTTSNALLLSANDTTFVYYQQSGDSFDASATGEAFTFKAWDGSAGEATKFADASTAGGTTAFSANPQSVTVNDVFSVSATDFSAVIGGSGFDTLKLSGEDMTLDLTVLGKLLAIEKIDVTGTNTVTGTGNNTVKLNLETITQADAEGSVHKLYIKGDEGDEVQLIGGPEGWKVANPTTETLDAVVYNVYQIGTDMTHQLLISQAITNVT